MGQLIIMPSNRQRVIAALRGDSYGEESKGPECARTSENALNSTGRCGMGTPITALKHYTRAQKASIAAALKAVQQMATKASPDTEVEVV